MRQVLHTGRSSARAVLAAAMLLGLLPAGCGDDAGKPNLPPTVTLTEFPDPGTSVTTSTRFAWTGSDPDGMIGSHPSLQSWCGRVPYRTVLRPLRCQAPVPPRTETAPSKPCSSRK